MSKMKELGEKLAAKRLAVKGIVDEAGGFDVLDFSKVTSLTATDEKARLEEFQAMVAELAPLEDEYQGYVRAEKSARENEEKMADMNRPVNQLQNPWLADPNDRKNALVKTLGELITESPYFKNYDPHSNARGGGPVGLSLNAPDDQKQTAEPIDMKTIMTTTTGIVPASNRGTRVVAVNQPRPVVADLIPQVTTTEKFAVWLEETTHTNNAAAVAENAEKPESALAYTERSETMRKIAHHIPVTTEQIQYVPSFMNIINGRMLTMLKRKEEAALLTGNGAPNITGFLNKSGILTQAKGADSNAEATLKAFTKVRIGAAFAEPSGVVYHPTNWEQIRLMRTNGGEGEFLWGSPAEAGEERIWGKPVVQTPEMTLGTGLTGDFANYSEIARFGGVRFEVGYIDRQLVENAKTLLVEEFLLLQIFNAAAFATITGLEAEA